MLNIAFSVIWYFSIVINFLVTFLKINFLGIVIPSQHSMMNHLQFWYNLHPGITLTKYWHG